MKKTLGISFFAFLIYLLSSIPAWSATVDAEVLHSQDRYPAGGTYPVLIRLIILKDWYIHGAKDEGSGLIKTELSFQDNPETKVRGVTFPAPQKEKFEYASEPVEVYSGEVLVRATLVVDGDARAGNKTIKGRLHYQACTGKLCKPPEDVSLSLLVGVVPRGVQAKAVNQDLFLSSNKERYVEIDLPGTRAGAGFWFTLVCIFAGGLALNLTPCVYPLIPITVSYFGGKSQKITSSSVLHGLLYISGLGVTNSVLGVSAALSGGMLGSALQNPWVLISVAAIMVGMGLSFFGFYEFRIPLVVTRVASKSYGGVFGTFFMGLTLGIVAAPCLGPFILGLLTYVGQKGDPFLGFLYFFVLSLGLGLPLSMLAVFSSSIQRLPRSGDWMVWVRRLMGWVLVGMAAYMISPLVPHFLGGFWLSAVVAIGAGIQLGWFDRSGKNLRKFNYLKKITGIVLIVGASLYMLSGLKAGEGITWMPYDPDLISRATAEGKPVILEFYADWCVPCRELDKEVFRDPEVLELSRHFVTIRMDLTHRKPMQGQALKQYDVKGVPMLVFLNRHGIEEEELRIGHYVPKSVVLTAMRGLIDSAPAAGGRKEDAQP